MEIITKTEPVHYLIHNGVEINAGELRKHLNDMMWADRTTFEARNEEDMAILDLIKKENDEFMKAHPGHEQFYHEHQLATGSIRLEWCDDHDDLIESLLQKIYDLLETVGVS